jgi:hypothetical protein
VLFLVKQDTVTKIVVFWVVTLHSFWADNEVQAEHAGSVTAVMAWFNVTVLPACPLAP